MIPIKKVADLWKKPTKPLYRNRPGYLSKLHLCFQRRTARGRQLLRGLVDMVARKLVKKTVLVGREALDNRSMLDLRRPLERGVIKEGSGKDDEAVQELLRHLTSLIGIKPRSKNRGKVRAVVGVPAEAGVGQQRKASERHGWDCR